MAIPNRKIMISICILILFVFLWCIKMYHKDLCKGFIDEKSFVLGESTIKDMQKRFLFKDSLLQKVELVVSTSCCWNNDFKETDFAQKKDEIFREYNKYIHTIKSKNSASKCFNFQNIDTAIFHKTTLFKWGD